MFSHEAIKSLRHYCRMLPKTSEAYVVSKDLATAIWQSHKFHFGNATDVTEIVGINGRRKNDPKAFSDPTDNDLILPYNTCWFDFNTPFDEMKKVLLDTGEIVPIKEHIKTLACVYFCDGVLTSLSDKQDFYNPDHQKLLLEGLLRDPQIYLFL